MAVPPMLRGLYVGRSKPTAQQIEQALRGELHARDVSLGLALHLVHATSQKAALYLLRDTPVHCLFLEVDGRRRKRIAFCNTLRKRYPKLPMIAVCSGPLPQHSFPFDGVIQQPLDLSQAQAALGNILERCQEAQLHAGSIHLDLSTRTLRGPAGHHRLPPKQCHLLQVLMCHQGETVSREAIMWKVWETEYMEDTRTLDVHVRWLREKIEPDPSRPVHLLTVRGEGYRLVG